jgi:hypothetical protein
VRDYPVPGQKNPFVTILRLTRLLIRHGRPGGYRRPADLAFAYRPQ